LLVSLRYNILQKKQQRAILEILPLKTQAYTTRTITQTDIHIK